MNEMIELKHLKVGDQYASEISASEILAVGKDFVETLCLKGPGMGEKRKRSGSALSWYLGWLNSNSVRKVE